MESEADKFVKKLNFLKTTGGKRITNGLDEPLVAAFVEKDPLLQQAIDQAFKSYATLSSDEKKLLTSDEAELVSKLQNKLVNFYPADGVNPYIPLAAKGPWIVTTHGAVLHDSGGYGMLGLGHNPDVVNEALMRPQVMANVMTPSLSQKRFTEHLKREIGHTTGKCPFSDFICMNSGSEAVTITARIVDIHAKNQTDKGRPHEGKEIRTLALEDSFHGRTGFPAKLSHSTREEYKKRLASFRGDMKVDFIPINDLDALEKTFVNAEKNNIFYQAFYIEPVMGEGIPGQAIDREFYDKLRGYTKAHRSLLIVDSIQAAIRAQGCLSLVDYPDFVGCSAPDMETYSKALNAGQYPLSVVALNKDAAEIYKTGVYGNTMTTNPRGLDVGSAVLESITDELRNNIREKGKELLDKFLRLKDEMPEAILEVVGTGLMVSVMLNPDHYTVAGAGGFEEYLRKHGIGMIHGGPNGLRFTPHFDITSSEIDLIVEGVKKGLQDPVLNKTLAQ